MDNDCGATQSTERIESKQMSGQKRVHVIDFCPSARGSVPFRPKKKKKKKSREQ